MKRIYLDYAAATPVAPEVQAVMQSYLADKFYNPSATYLASKAVGKDIEAARAKIAHWLGSRPGEVVFTAGGTEANNLAINGVMQQFPGKQLLVSSIEHDSVLAPAKQYKAKEIPVDLDGRLNIAKLQSLINKDTVLVSVMYANNEIGTIQPIREIGRMVAEVRKDRVKQGNKLPLYLHTDACQAAAYLDLHVDRLGVDLMTINSGKIYGPKQVGALYIKAGTLLMPQTLGGGQERNVRSGTENVAGIVGFVAALDLVQTRRKQEGDRLRILSSQFIAGLTKAIPNAVVNGSSKFRLPNNVHITIPGSDNERLIMELDEKGIMCAAGSACSASNDEASHVLRAIGRTDEQAYSSLRLTFGSGTSQSDLEQTAKVLASLV